MNERTARLQEVFNEALDYTIATERETYLSRACGDDPSLRQEVDELLEAQRVSEAFLPADPSRESAVLLPGVDASIEDVSGTMIGRYKLLEWIGEGGFGVVYMAEQEEPFRRKVALKVIKLGMDTKQVIARFETERQALAMMDHPNIAKVFDAGATETGRPYFVMELVGGIPITRFCEENQLTVKERLQLFIPVCHAIQHAHQKGIIHRDIKPSNLLVTVNDGVPHPMVIDFGVAKAIDQRLTEKTLYTGFAQMIGTPAYMSPEQAEMSKQDVDTRTDVYSLGILLYELLTGTTPFPEERLRKAGYAEIQRIITQEEAVRPSGFLSRASGRSRTVAGGPGSEPESLAKLIKGDLDWIVLKAIDKDRNRRYETANGLAADLRRHLSDEPVTASPPGTLYQLSKFARRHRTGVSAGLIVVFAVLTGLVLSVTGFVKASSANARAEREAAEAEATLKFIEEELLNPLNPFEDKRLNPLSDVDVDSPDNPGRDVSLLEAVKRAADKMSNRFADQPLVEASLRLKLGQVLLGLGEADLAGPHFERSVELSTRELGPNHLQTLEAEYCHAEVLKRVGRRDEALPIHERILQERLFRLGPNARPTLESRKALAWALYYDNPTNYTRAESLFRQVITDGSPSLGAMDPLILEAKQGLSEVQYETGRFQESFRLDEEIFEARKQVLSPGHPDYLHSAAMRAYDLRYRMGDYHAADVLGKETLEACLRVLGPDHPTTLLMVKEQGSRLGDKGLWQVALESRFELLETARARYGEKHPTTLWAEDLLGDTLSARGDHAEAEKVLRATVSARERMGKTRFPSEDLRGQRWLANVVLLQGRVEEAEQLIEDGLRRTIDAGNGVSPHVLSRAASVIGILGTQADWRTVTKRYLEFAPYVAMGEGSGNPLGRLTLSAGVLAAQLAGDPTATRQLFDLLMERHGRDTNLVVSRSLALAGLALPPEVGTVAQRQEILQMGTLTAANSSDPLESTLVAGMKAFRQREHDRAARQLGLLTSNPEPAVASTAGFVRAMALFRMGQEAEAQQALSAAREELEVGLRPGLLGPAGAKGFANADPQWADYARCLVLRNEAEKLIQGRITSPPVNRETLKARRIAWQPLQDLLEEAHRHGRNRDWGKARDAFARAMDQGPINWENNGNLIRNLHMRAATVFALTGDTNRYSALCRRLLDSAATSQFYFARPVYLATDWLAVDPQSRGPAFARSPNEVATLEGTAQQQRVARLLEMARWRVSFLSPGMLAGSYAALRPGKPTVDFDEYATLYLGIAEYRAGQLAEALVTLGIARNAYDLDVAGTAHAFSALAANATGQPDKATQYLEEAESIFQELLAGNADRLGREWHKVAVLELALREAQAAITVDAGN